jgi:transposase-like protein
MTPRRRLSRADRQAILRGRGRGLTHEVLAERFGVSKRTIYYALRLEAEGRRERLHRSKSVSVTVTEDELEALDRILAAHGISSRADGLRRLIQAADGVFLPDEALADELRDFRAALNRVGNNVSQIAKRMNEANRKGARPSFGPGSLAQMRSLARYVLDFADRIDLLTRRRTQAATLRVTAALEALADGAE